MLKYKVFITSLHEKSFLKIKSRLYFRLAVYDDGREDEAMFRCLYIRINFLVTSCVYLLCALVYSCCHWLVDKVTLGITI